eukprot:scaffold65629_cov19-Tisochrysis_lutea.AAC.1
MVGEIQSSIRTTGGESSSLRECTMEEVQGYNYVQGMCRKSKVVLRQQIFTFFVCVVQACFPRAFAKRFCDHPASNIMGLVFVLTMIWIWQPGSIWSAPSD